MYTEAQQLVSYMEELMSYSESQIETELTILKGKMELMQDALTFASDLGSTETMMIRNIQTHNALLFLQARIGIALTIREAIWSGRSFDALIKGKDALVDEKSLHEMTLAETRAYHAKLENMSERICMLLATDIASGRGADPMAGDAIDFLRAKSFDALERILTLDEEQHQSTKGAN